MFKLSFVPRVRPSGYSSWPPLMARSCAVAAPRLRAAGVAPTLRLGARDAPRRAPEKDAGAVEAKRREEVSSPREEESRPREEESRREDGKGRLCAVMEAAQAAAAFRRCCCCAMKGSKLCANAAIAEVETVCGPGRKPPCVVSVNKRMEIKRSLAREGGAAEAEAFHNAAAATGKRGRRGKSAPLSASRREKGPKSRADA